MTNYEKYPTAEERAKGFETFCAEHICETCPLNGIKPDCGDSRGQFAWLDLEAEEEKPLPCPLCGGRMGVHGPHLKCVRCRLSIFYGTTTKEVVSAFNRIARAMMDAGRKDEGHEEW